jgi:hypothetical protein
VSAPEMELREWRRHAAMAGLSVDVFIALKLEWSPQDWGSNSPDVFFHFFVFEGELSPTLLNLRGVPHPQQLVGRRRIGGHLGNLYQQVSYSLCSECSFTGHLTFIWKERRLTYAASLHRWTAGPSASVIALLNSLVADLRNVK